MKECLDCGCEFLRKPTESNIEWSQRRYCSARCGLAGAAKAGSNGGTPATAEGQVRALKAACEAHLRALIRYGIANDNDLGMGFGPFMETAKRLGLA